MVSVWILQVLSLGKRKRVEVTQPISHPEGWVFKALDTQETDSNRQHKSHPMDKFSLRGSGERRCTSVVSQHLALGVRAALGEIPC